MSPSSTQRILDAAREAYGLQLLDQAADLGSNLNVTLLVSDGTRRWVLHSYHPHTSRERLESIQRVRDALRDGGVPIPDVVPTRDGPRCFIVDDRVGELENFVPGEDMTTVDRLLRGMHLLGRIHDTLQAVGGEAPVQVAPYANYADASEVLDLTQERGEQLRSRSLLQRPELTHNAARLAEIIAEPDRAFAAGLPRQLVHGDYWDNNVLFRGDAIVAVIDFDFMGLRTRVDDLGLILCYANTGHNIDDPVERRLEESRRIVDAYDAGVGQRLSAQERLALPYVMVRNVLPPFCNLVHVTDRASRRRYEDEMARELTWAHRVTGDIRRWQAALTT